MMRLVLVVALGFMVGDASARIRPRRAVCYGIRRPSTFRSTRSRRRSGVLQHRSHCRRCRAPVRLSSRPLAFARKKSRTLCPSRRTSRKTATPRTRKRRVFPRSALPPLPGDPPKREPAADRGKAVEQFFIPADPKRAEPRAEVKVGFFNHSDRAIVLQVNGEAVRLPSEEYVTLRSPRKFSWAEKGDTRDRRRGSPRSRWD